MKTAQVICVILLMLQYQFKCLQNCFQYMVSSLSYMCYLFCSG